MIEDQVEAPSASDGDPQWTYKSAPIAAFAEIERQFPGALAWFDWACSNIAQGAARFVIVKDVLRVSVRCARQGPAWNPKMGIWIRFSMGVKAKPYVDQRKMPADAIRSAVEPDADARYSA